MNNFIEHRNFLKIYEYNKLYKKEDRTHHRALGFQAVIIFVVIVVAVVNNHFDPGFGRDLYLDQINRIYALLVALLTAILLGITPLDKDNRLCVRQHDYCDVTFKQDYTSLIMYTIWLFLVGIAVNVSFASFFQYFEVTAIDNIFWAIRLFILCDSVFFSVYCVDELADLIQKV